VQTHMQNIMSHGAYSVVIKFLLQYRFCMLLSLNVSKLVIIIYLLHKISTHSTIQKRNKCNRNKPKANSLYEGLFLALGTVQQIRNIDNKVKTL